MEETGSSRAPRKRSDLLAVFLGTGAGVGLIPPKLGTLGTLLGIPLAFGLSSLGWAGYLGCLVFLWVIGIPICRRAADALGEPDPRSVVWDEFTTLPLVYLGVDRWTVSVLVVGFIAHRFFDIVKPLGVRRLERLGGGLGIMADDILAGFYGFLVLRALAYLQIWPFP